VDVSFAQDTYHFKCGPSELRMHWKGSKLRLEYPQARVYLGLGQQFHPQRQGLMDGDWKGLTRFFGAEESEPHPFGNRLVSFSGGNVGNTSFPLLYLVGPQGGFLVLLDTPYKQRWDLRGNAVEVELNGPVSNLYVAAGPDLPSLRRNLMRLTGRPPVPPRSAFGLWVSEYGFDNWDELKDKLKTLREQHFPVSGFVLDLQWFGGIQSESPLSRMGCLTFDEKNFPQPQETMAELKRQGLGLVAIEEPFISSGLPEHKQLAERGFLAKDAQGQPLLLNETPWWGIGGILDYSNPEASSYWHQTKRKPLIDMGLTGHWTDLGEPENYQHKQPDGSFEQGRYYRGQQAEVHNLYNLFWAESIAEGYRKEKQRPWILSRSGGPGLQRFGAAMWSGDIGANGASLASHYNVQMHMSLSGIDYFGSDIGGFHRDIRFAPFSGYDAMYTRWFADACMTDVPIRPHTNNIENRYQTAPDRCGDKASNLANLKLRYRLNPYYYSLAHLAHRQGEPLIAPVLYHFPQCWDLARSGQLKMIGPWLLTAMVAGTEKQLKLTLPPGKWCDFRTHRWVQGQLQHSLWGPNFRLPLLARAGAILPLEDCIRVYAGPASQFEWVEDDGFSQAYLQGKLGRTSLRQKSDDRHVSLEILARQGSFEGANQLRKTCIEVVPPQAGAWKAKLNGQPIPVSSEKGLLRIQAGSRPVQQSLRLELFL
jgi:alpha-glucosidase (family GH31 glycosyl hydrolase)